MLNRAIVVVYTVNGLATNALTQIPCDQEIVSINSMGVESGGRGDVSPRS